MRKKYYVCAPAGLASGGPELAHQMCCELLREGRYARMYYSNGKRDPVDMPANARYDKYRTSHVTDVKEVEQEDSVIIIPEGMIGWNLFFEKCQKVLWWMSVDNYLDHERLIEMDLFSAVRQEISLHLVQSQYAFQYLLSRGIPSGNILKVSDYISENYGQYQLPVEFRRDIALYNPKKGYNEIKPLIEKAGWLKWVPLTGLTEEQMEAAMQIAKVYVDFGNHPGKDRIPREAASCGCCVITNKKGSAAYYEDVPIPDCYKIDHVSMEYERTAELLKDICTHWEEHHMRFDEYRKMISSEKRIFTESVKRFVQMTEHEGYGSGH